MSFEANTQLFGIVGTGYVAEQHAEEKHRHLLEGEKNAVGVAMAWLAFYAMAVVVVVITNLSAGTPIVLSALK
jgi:hypothetical protein